MLRNRNVHPNSDLGWNTLVLDCGNVTADMVREAMFYAHEGIEVREFAASCTGFSGFSACDIKLSYTGITSPETYVESTTKGVVVYSTLSLSAAGRKRKKFDPPLVIPNTMPSGISFNQEFSEALEYIKAWVDVTGTGTISNLRVSIMYRVRTKSPQK